MTRPNILIRSATIDDAGAITAFNQAMALETEGKDLAGATVEAGVRHALADREASRYYIAEVDGTVAGQTMITVEWSDWRNALFWWIQSVYVDPRFRRQGVFRALHAYVRGEAKKLPNVCGLRLYVHNENQRAMATYLQLGMTKTDYLLCEEDWSQESAT